MSCSFCILLQSFVLHVLTHVNVHVNKVISLLKYTYMVIYSIRHAHYQAGNTPLTLVWKDENCSQYVIDTDSKGQIPHQQQVFQYCIPWLLVNLTLNIQFWLLYVNHDFSSWLNDRLYWSYKMTVNYLHQMIPQLYLAV